MHEPYIHTYIHTYDLSERALLTTAIEQAGCTVYTENVLDKILEKWWEQPADLLVAVLQPENLYRQVESIRYVTNAPLIIVSNRMGEDQHVALYKAGADAVLMRPYSVKLLVAQAVNLARRGRAMPLQQIPPLTIGALTVDPAARTVSHGATVHPLTAREFQLLYLFCNNQNQILSFERIVEQVWGYSDIGDDRGVRNLITRLRKKLLFNEQKMVQIESVSGLGYRMVIKSNVDCTV